MIGNPEFRRNLWLELTPQRLVVMPVVLAAIFVVIYLGEAGVSRWTREASYGGLATAAKYIYLALVLLWGGRQSGSAVTDETRDRTWDGQRLSALGSWSMSWGKLFGSTVFTWYGGAIALAVYVLAGLHEHPAPDVATEAVTLVAYGVLCQATALLASLLYLRHKAPTRRATGALFHVIGLAAVAALWWAAGSFDTGVARWPFGVAVSRESFELASSVIFAIWAVVGVWRLMRAELQFRNLPWLWTLFALYLVLYGARFLAVPAEPTIRFFGPAAVLFGCTYLLALVEPKDVVGLRRLAGRARAGAWRGFFEVLPLWLLTFVFAGVAVALTIALDRSGAGTPQRGVTVALLVASYLFMTRDVAILLALNLGRNPRRADLAAVLYWAVLYALVPLVLDAFGQRSATVLFRPDGTPATVVSAGVQAALGLIWVAWRWRSAGRAIGVIRTA
ncbi:MAG: hypothetical protein ACM3N5_16780 [Candidatus Eiseniibacteriota bacterium]